MLGPVAHQLLPALLDQAGLRFLIAVVLMAVVGACEALTALLIKPVFDRVLDPQAESTPILLFQLPWQGGGIYLQDFLPKFIHNVWTVVAIAIIAVGVWPSLMDWLTVPAGRAVAAMFGGG